MTRAASFAALRVLPLDELKIDVGFVHGLGKSATDAALVRGIAIGEGVNFARDLGNLPPNICTPAYLAEQSRALGRSHKLKVSVLERKDMEKLGMGSLLSVSDGSRQPPKLITLEHRGGPRQQKPVVLVGKGITFDTGGDRKSVV